MFTSRSLLALAYLLVPPKGRGRYSGRSRKGEPPRKNQDRTGNRRPPDDSVRQREPHELPLPPPLTYANGPRPSYFTCRHSYEATLMEELQRQSDAVDASSPFPGLVRVEDGGVLPKNCQPVYALQSLPHVAVVEADSIKGLAKQIHETLLGDNHHGDDDTASALRAAPRGSLAIHALVPGMCKGQKNPIQSRRSAKIAEELAGMLQKGFVAARRPKDDDDISLSERWLLQVLLLTPTVAATSLTQCMTFDSGNTTTWPNWYLPAGMALADLEDGDDIPSSAYRKLVEALGFMRCCPSLGQTVVDLGASPGGWTAVLRQLGCRVIAVDRSELAPDLMQDDMVEFVQGDAFTYVPESRLADDGSLWMVSDVIAYPDKIATLLDRWCGGHWASHMVVTLKFQGDTPAWEELEHAQDIARKHSYHCQAKHFFNNKNEVTLMLQELQDNAVDVQRRDGPSIQFLGKPMYPVTLPKATA